MPSLSRFQITEADEAFRIGNLPDGLNVSATERPPDAYGQVTNLGLKQDVQQFGLAGKIWHSAYLLQSFFSFDTKNLDPVNPIPPVYDYNADPPTSELPPYQILELGAGTGYVGIHLANILRTPCQVVITDLEQVLPLIEDNVETHFIGGQGRTRPRVEPLHWGNHAHAKALLRDGPPDLVVVSDCVYFPELFPLLTETLNDVCGPHTKVVIGYKCRSLEKEVGFWQDHFGRYFSYEPVRRLPTVDEEGQELEEEGLYGDEEGMFIFIGSKRPEDQIKQADDTFTTLLFCSMGF